MQFWFVPVFASTEEIVNSADISSVNFIFNPSKRYWLSLFDSIAGFMSNG